MSSARKPKTIDPDKVDPSVYFYDEVYDDMKQEEEKSRSRGKQSSADDRHKGSKYIDGLKETAKLRKTEKELRKFKRYAKNREEAEAEGDVSREDVYISDSYKRKLKEIKQIEREKLRRHEQEEDKTMNFMKKNSRGEKSESSSKKHKSETKSSPVDDSRQQSSTMEHAETSRIVEPHEDDDPNARNVTRNKKPKTIEERRRYLREVLRKRTIGKIYDEAVQRYIQRKALSQR